MDQWTWAHSGRLQCTEYMSSVQGAVGDFFVELSVSERSAILEGKKQETIDFLKVILFT